MRAHWLESLVIQDSYILRDDSLHHLVNVLRIETGEELMLLNGKGLVVQTCIESISKKEIRLKYIRHEEAIRHYQFDLALGMPKRDALELCLKQATELGFRKVYLIRSDFSQMRHLENDRTLKILVSALEQSNSPFLPDVVQSDWESIPWSTYQDALLLDSQTKLQTKSKVENNTAPRLLIVGPEGGFSPKELTFLHSEEKVKVINLPTPILRTPTALATGAGIMIESLLK